jgi:hypothetical protein
LAAINEAVSAKDRGDPQAKVAWETRSSFIERLTSEFSELSDDESDKIAFVSYSVNSGVQYFKYLEAQMKQRGFEVTTGFNPHPGDNDNILKRIRSQMNRSTVYIGLLTKEMQVRTTGENWLWSPSVWTMEEKGMALALQKPFVLMVEDGIHADFWRKTTPERVHHIFDSANYMEVTRKAVDAAEERYYEHKLRESSS